MIYIHALTFVYFGLYPYRALTEDTGLERTVHRLVCTLTLFLQLHAPGDGCETDKYRTHGSWIHVNMLSVSMSIYDYAIICHAWTLFPLPVWLLMPLLFLPAHPVKGGLVGHRSELLDRHNPCERRAGAPRGDTDRHQGRTMATKKEKNPKSTDAPCTLLHCDVFSALFCLLLQRA